MRTISTLASYYQRNTLLIALFAFLIINCQSLPVSEFYPFGNEAGDELKPRGEFRTSSPRTNISSPYRFYNRSYDSLFVNFNGVVSFQNQLILNYFSFPLLENIFIAPYWSPIDTRSANGGNIWFRETTNQTILEKATNDVRQVFSISDFVATWVFIATWDRVDRISGGGSSNRNTFQVILISGGQQSFVRYNFGLLQWVYLSHSGFNAGVGGKYYKLPGSGTSNILNLNKTSNIEVPGAWMYQVDGAEIFGPRVAIEFLYSNMSVEEESGLISVPVIKRVPPGGTAIPISVRLTMSANTATKNADYVDLNDTVTFAKDVNETLFNVTIINDDEVEVSELFFVGLEAVDPSTTIIGSKRSMKIQIMDTNDKATIEFLYSNMSVEEELGFISVPVIKRAPAAIPISVRLTINANTATRNVDYVDGNDTMLTFPKDVNELVFNVTIKNDDKVEGSEFFFVALEAVDPSTTIIGSKNSTKIQIMDTNDKATIEFRYSNMSVEEENGFISVPVIKRAPAGGTAISISVRLTMNGNTATRNVDYVDGNDTILTFPKDVNEMLFNVTIKNDDKVEGSEFFFVGLEAVDPSTTIIGSKNSTKIQIMDTNDKATIEFRYSNMSVEEENGFISVPVTKRAPAGGTAIPISVRLTMNGNTATKNVDYVDLNDKMLTFPKDVNELVFNVTIKNDDKVESSEFFLIGIEAVDPSTTMIGSKGSTKIQITDRIDKENQERQKQKQEEDRDQKEALVVTLLSVAVALLIVLIIFFVIAFVWAITRNKIQNV